MISRKLYLIAYDIADARRLVRVATCLSTYAVRIQYSVFVADLRHRELIDIVKQLDALIEPAYDDVRIYPVPRIANVAMLGNQLFPDDILALRDGRNLLRINKPVGTADES